VFIFILFLLGASIGSFIHALADRLCLDKPFVADRSECDFCKKKLGWKELIPVLSFFLQKGKCKHCKKNLSFWYPLSEIGTGLLFVVIFFISPSIHFFLFSLLLVSFLLCIALADAKYTLIPFPLIVIGSFSTFLYVGIFQNSELLSSVVSGALASLGFLFIYVITKGRGMGFGDVTFAFLMGALLRFPTVIVGLYVAFLTGAVISLILILLKKKKLKGDTIPFGPFLVIGTVVGYFFGDFFLRMASMYLNYGF